MKIRRIISLILALVLVFSISVYAEDQNEDLSFPKYIKVGLYWGTNSKSSLTISSEYGFNVFLEDGTFLYNIPETQITIEVGSDYLAESEGRIFLSAAEDIDNRIVQLNSVNDISSGKRYRDGFYLYQRNGGIRIINFVTLEHYVWGVVNREMNYSQPYEALKAQAVAARTYALEMHHSAYGFNVCATTDCQAYGGVASENDVTTQACRDTEGLALFYEGKPIEAYFSAASGGGYTMSKYDAWGTDDLPYLQSVADPYTPEYHWETDYKFSTIRTRIMDFYGTDIGEIRKFEITNHNLTGHVTQITVTGSNGVKVIPRSQIMSVFNLKSTFFCIGSSDYKEITKQEGTPDSMYVLSANGVSQVASSEIYVYNGSSVYKMPTFLAGSYSMEDDVCTDGMVYMRGLGHGHGIGMSQTGAYAMAKAGYTFEDILHQYYIGVTIQAAEEVF